MKSDPGTRAAIFDIGATLVTGPTVAPNKVIARLLGGVTAAEVASVIMTTPLECADDACAALEAAFGALDSAAVAGIRELYAEQSNAPRAIDGAVEAVQSLKRRGLRIGLLSDIWSPYYAGVCRAIPEVVDAADAVVLSCETGARKPAADNFRTVLDRLDASVEESVMVGDTYSHDILPALEMGMKAVWVLARPEREQPALVSILNGESPRPTITVADVASVAGLELWQVRRETGTFERGKA